MRTQLVAGLLVSTAMANTATAQAQQTSRDIEGAAEIIVTAQRRAENVQSVPISVTPVTSEELRSRNLNNLQQIALAAPSLQVGQENTYSIRGVGTLAFQQTVDPAVAIAQDEVNLARSALSEGVFNDVSQIEVLNGPQGLLFGKNATAGLLNITTTRPKFGLFSGDAEVEYDLRDTTPGNGQGVIARSSVNVPVGDTSALRLSVAYEYQEPVVRAVETGPGSDIDRRSFDTRLKYLAEPTDTLSIYAIGNYAKLRGTSGLFDRTYRYLGAGSQNTAPLAADGYTASPDLLEYKADGANFRNLENYGGQLRIGYTLPNEWEIINIGAYKGYKLSSSFDQDFTTGNAVSLSSQNSKFNQYSNELRLALPANSRLSGQVGLFYMRFTERASSLTAGNLYLPSFLLPNFPFCVGSAVNAPCPAANDFAIGSDSNYRFTSESAAAFGQFTYDVGSGLKVIAGGRLTRDKVSIDLVQNQLDYFVRFGGPGGTYSDSTRNTDFSWKLGAQYQATQDILLYGSYAKGYKGPGANNSAATVDARLVVNPETSRNIELGAKTSWLDRKLVFNVALFRTKYKDYQASAFNAQAASFVIQNAASLTTKGAEVTLTAKPVRGFSINATASILDSKFADFPGAACYTGQPDCGANGTFNAGGQRTPTAAKFTSSVGAAYEVPISDATSLVLSGDWYHRSAVNFTLGNNPLTRFGAIDLFGARATLQLGDNVSLSVFCKNCGDTRVPNFIYQDPGDASVGVNSAVQTFGLNSVRTIGSSVGFRF